MFNLRLDPYERADITSNTYYDWTIQRAFLIVPAQAMVAQFIETFRDFPPRRSLRASASTKVIGGDVAAGQLGALRATVTRWQQRRWPSRENARLAAAALIVHSAAEVLCLPTTDSDESQIVSFCRAAQTLRAAVSIRSKGIEEGSAPTANRRRSASA
jgi:hypothetical protein